MRTFYTEYVNHILRHYIRYGVRPESFRAGTEAFRTDAEKANLKAAELVLAQLPEQEQRIVTEVYSAGRTGEGIMHAAEICGIPQDRICRLIGSVSKRIARERGLI